MVVKSCQTFAMSLSGDPIAFERHDSQVCRLRFQVVSAHECPLCTIYRATVRLRQWRTCSGLNRSEEAALTLSCVQEGTSLRERTSRASVSNAAIFDVARGSRCRTSRLSSTVGASRLKCRNASPSAARPCVTPLLVMKFACPCDLELHGNATHVCKP